jgi:WS/DGAT/MGAT family acyltransferase
MGEPERLSATDMSSLLAERGPIHVHVGATIIVEGEPPSYEELLRETNRRLSLVPRFRQKVTKTPLRLANPVWADDPNFDLRWHVRHAALPRPGDDRQLRDLVGRVMSEPLDMGRPLWQIYLIEGLKGGRHAYISKTHHALVDGVAAVDVGTILLDPTPAGGELKLPRKRWEPDEPSPEMLFVRAASDRVAAPLRTASKAARSALTMPRETATSVMKTADSFRKLATSGPSCPRSPLNVDIGPHRRVAFVKTTLKRLQDARGRTGATINDVILAVAAGGLRHYLQRRDEGMPEHLVALVPVSVRRPNEKNELGNRMSTILVPLPIGESNPRRRLKQIREETERLKKSEQARAASLVIQATGWAPPTINRVVSQVMAQPRVFNLVVSNVPGPQQPFYLMGRKLLEIYPFVPLSPQGHALSIGVLSYDGRVYFGIAGDRDVVSDIDRLASDLRASLKEIAPPRRSRRRAAGPRAAGPTSTPTRGPSARRRTKRRAKR